MRVRPGIEESLKLNFFIERGYTRKRCPKCGEHFWTLDPDREVCGESPCEPYSFIGRGLSKKFSVADAREGFLSFMESRGHTRIGRYPVVARWRDDLFLTSASIVDFQPFVTAGLVPPPANPLTISQPCIRLKDIDKVGLTMGRHLTIFEMMAHHAFNTPREEVYWKERTLELFHEYATSVLSVPEEEIIYKEGWWEGGGNAGPDVEPIVAGLEIATLVFMEYKVRDGVYEKMSTRVVDTGYGLERITWLSQGTPTAFDAVYGHLVDRFLDLLGIERPDRSLMERYSTLSSLTAHVEKGKKLKELRRVIASQLELDPEELDVALSPVELAYSVLDHTKTVAFMLADGLVPSNSKEGYLGRLVIRRTLRALRSLGAEVPLADLVDLQLEYWGSQFPELLEKRDRILDMVSVEEARFLEVLKKGRQLIERELKKLKRSRGVPLDFLLELYDSHGVPPELAAEVAREHGVDIEVPDNFYELVAARHEAPEVKPPELPPYLEEVEAMPKTELLFYKDPYARTFKAKVVGLLDDALVLDRTAFYPEGGGQPSDTGFLILSDGTKLKVVRAEKVKDRVLHFVEGELSKVRVGDEVSGEIDWPKRISLMRHHTATHVLLESAKRVLGDHVWQWGAQKGETESRLDVTHYKSVTDEELRRIDLLANSIVMENRRVITKWMPRQEAERVHGFEIYQGGVVPDLNLRIVEIEGFNVQACAGTHVMRTGEIGPIKILRARRIQDGVVRFEFSAGMAAVEKLLEAYERMKRISSVVGAPLERAEDAVETVVKENRELSKRLREALENLLVHRIRDAQAAAIGNLEFRVVEVELDDRKALTDAADSYVREHPETVLCLVGGSGRRQVVLALGALAIERGLDAGRMLSEVLS
ncbi:MAG TPA: alanine--tRNA ligase, partial [Candidatus Korarchaeota archaeon]|nr:alanine--tRNA ligase [Candidatus Korarchaeota archaeon]